MTKIDSVFTEGGPKVAQTTVRLTPEEHDQLAEVAARYRISISEAARQAILYALQVEKLPTPPGTREPPKTKKTGNVKIDRLRQRPQG